MSYPPNLGLASHTSGCNAWPGCVSSPLEFIPEPFKTDTALQGPRSFYFGYRWRWGSPASVRPYHHTQGLRQPWADASLYLTIASTFVYVEIFNPLDKMNDWIAHCSRTILCVWYHQAGLVVVLENLQKDSSVTRRLLSTSLHLANQMLGRWLSKVHVAWYGVIGANMLSVDIDGLQLHSLTFDVCWRVVFPVTYKIHSHNSLFLQDARKIYTNRIEITIWKPYNGPQWSPLKALRIPDRRGRN